MKKLHTLSAATMMIAALGLTGCTVEPESASSEAPSDGAQAESEIVLETNQELHDALPEDIKDAGTIVAVNSGSFPPYTVIDSNNELSGATAEVGEAIGQILGVEIEHNTVDGLASVLAGMDAGRFDLDLGPVGDYEERHAQATFIDWVQEYVVFAVEKGNPESITGLESVCGTSIAVQAGGSAERVIKEQSDKCVEEGKEPVDVQSYKDQPSSVLAVQSSRADAFFSSQAPLTYFVEQSDGALELAGTGKSNGFDDILQGALVPKGSPLEDTMLEAFKILFDSGRYEEIMTEYGLEGNMIEAPGLNMGS
ncbi:ABC transporter substrate-binding protein [Arthrobacter roseus]|uniref:ABC transporter substrate-binding protein n=1 Tax=Arthrobacter roseus TaxID=136274 RepID=UPI001962379E|nr:ABC transporter substrate-binding protein [Arthrobacter roseus]MBM7847858.1 polar amino acid transport system substrate-binding protein [Arthrobacter roseus]